MQEECSSRAAKVREEMRKAGLDGLVVTDPVSYAYFTGQKAAPGSDGRVVAFILPLEGEPAIIDWSGPGMFARLYRRPYPAAVADRRIYPEVPFNREACVDWGIRDVLAEKGLLTGRVGIELGNEPYMGLGANDFARLRSDLPGVEWVDSSAVVWAVRMIKSEWEISRLMKACEIGANAWGRCLTGLRVGDTQREIQGRILRSYVELGADVDSRPPVVLGATGAGGAFQKGDILYLDGGCSAAGYKMDFTRRAVFGAPSARQQAEHDGMWNILFEVMDRIRPGVSTASVFEYSQSLIAKTPWTNYSDHPSKRIGHGIGLTNEPPYINAFDQHEFQAGMSITPEPKIETVEGLLNAEEHVIVRERGCEVISSALDWKLFRVD
jgi:Xaa-Pro aminopeptidase